MKKRIGLVLILVLILAFSGFGYADSRDDLNKTDFTFDLKLKDPELVPPAVQMAVFDVDPIWMFKGQVISYHDQNVAIGFDRPSEIEHEWNSIFKSITGDRLYLLTMAPVVGSYNTDSKIWITTKTVRIANKPVCWCVPLEGKKGKEYQIILSKDNRVDLEKIYNEALKKLDK